MFKKKPNSPFRAINNSAGFTLLELLIVVAILGILTAIAIPSVSSYRERAQVTSVASNLKNFGLAFRSVEYETGSYPPDSHIVLPAGMNQLIDNGLWLAATPFGGNYNWEGPDSYPYAGIAILGATNTAAMLKLDNFLDDGNLATGSFRLTPNGRHTYILDE